MLGAWARLVGIRGRGGDIAGRECREGRTKIALIGLGTVIAGAVFFLILPAAAPGQLLPAGDKAHLQQVAATNVSGKGGETRTNQGREPTRSAASSRWAPPPP